MYNLRPLSAPVIRLPQSTCTLKSPPNVDVDTIPADSLFPRDIFNLLLCISQLSVPAETAVHLVEFGGSPFVPTKSSLKQQQGQ